MSTYALGESVSMRAYWLGRLIGGLVIPFLPLDGVRMGYGSSGALARALGAISMPCLALTAFPPTSIVGAILWTGYLGDVVAAHLKFF